MNLPMKPRLEVIKPIDAARTRFCRFVLALLALGATHTMMGATEQEYQRTGLEGIPVKPSDTDAAIRDFDSPHYIYVDRSVIIAHQSATKDRHELFLYLTGTGGSGRTAIRFCQDAARDDYRVVNLMYPDEIPAAVCRDDKDPSAFEDFRMAIIQGGKTNRITVSRTDSIENRLSKVLLFLKRTRPREEWGQFLSASGELNWEMIATGGQSQGGGHAALLGIKHRMARIIGTGAPKDYSIALEKPAAWYLDESATPKNRFFFLNHDQDFQGCTPEQCLENIRALGLAQFGPPVSVDSVPFPYQHSRILTTNYPGGKKLDSRTAHTTGIAGPNEAVFSKSMAVPAYGSSSLAV